MVKCVYVTRATTIGIYSMYMCNKLLLGITVCVRRWRLYGEMCMHHTPCT